MTDRELLKEARDLIVMCSLIDKSNQCNDMANKIDEQLAIPRVSQQRELLIAFVDAWDKDEINVYNPPNEIADEFLAIYSG